MAIDTQTKRLSLINLGHPSGRVLPEPTGTLDQGDRQHLLGYYSGINFQSVTPQAASLYYFMMMAEQQGDFWA